MVPKILKTLPRRAGLWVLVMHAATWIVIALQSLATGSGYRAVVVHLPRATLLQQSWIIYGAMAGGIVLLLLAVFVWYGRSAFGTLWKITPSDRGLFWGELRFNAIGIGMVLALSIASLAAHKWVLDYLERLPEAGFVRFVFAESQVKLSLYEKSEYFWPKRPTKGRTRADTDMPTTSSGRREKTPPEETYLSSSDDRAETTNDRKAARSRLIDDMVVAWVSSMQREEDLVHMVFPIHAVLMALLYLGFCRMLTARHRVMSA